MAHEIFEEPLLLVVWLVIVVVLLGAVLLAGIDTSKLLTMTYLKIYNNRVTSLINIASSMPEGSEINIPLKPDYSIGDYSIKIHQSLSSRYIEVISTLKLEDRVLNQMGTQVPFTGLFATHTDPVLREKYIVINYLYQTEQGFGYVSPYSGAFISRQMAVVSDTPLTLEKVINTQIRHQGNYVTIQELNWVYDASDKDYLHLEKKDGLLIIKE